MKIERMTHTNTHEQRKKQSEERMSIVSSMSVCVCVYMHSSHARIEKPSNVVVNKHFQSREITMAYILK